MTRPTAHKFRMSANKSYLNEGNIFQEYENPYNLTLPQFKFILKTFFVILVNDIIHNGTIFKLPNKLGKLGILKRKVEST